MLRLCPSHANLNPKVRVADDLEVIASLHESSCR
jgi:hypothetical protein